MGQRDIPGSISVLVLSPVVDALSTMGADTGAILSRAGLGDGALDDPEARLGAGAAFRLWESAVEVTGDPALGLRVAEASRPGGAGAFEYMLRHSASLAEGLARAERYVRVLDDLCCVSVRRVKDIAVLRLWRQGGHPFPPADIERFFALCAAALSAEFPAHRLHEVRLPHACAGDAAVYRAHFGCPVRFEQPHAELRFAAAALAQQPRNADPGLGLVLESHVEQLVAQLPNEAPFLQQARRAMTLQLQREQTGMDRLARSLAVSQRTLRRRLSEHGYGYTELLDELRQNLADHHLQRTELSLEQVAGRLGFADTTAFYRWFKRWAGCTPGQFRKDRKEGEP